MNHLIRLLNQVIMCVRIILVTNNIVIIKLSSSLLKQNRPTLKLVLHNQLAFFYHFSLF